MKQITVIIPNFNGEKYLLDCLKSVYENTALEVDVIVVDNASKDNSICLAMEHFPQVQYVLLDENYGFSKAVNEGIKRAKTPYVFLLNNDAMIQKNCLETLLTAMRSSGKIFSVETKMVQYQNPERIDSAGTFYNAFGWASARGKGKPVSKYEKQEQTFAACAGAALYRKQILDKLGLFDENYFAYLEDIDVGYRAKKKGFINIYEPKAQVIHVGSASSGSRYNDFKVRYSARNNLYLINQNMPWWQIILNGPLLLAGFVIKAGFFFLKGFGKTYIDGLREGMIICKAKGKPKFT